MQITPVTWSSLLARRLDIAFVLSLGATTPVITPFILRKRVWRFVLSLGVTCPLITPVTWLSLSFVNFVFREASIIDYIRDSAPLLLLSSRFTVCFSTFNGNQLPLMTLVDLSRGGPAYFQSNCQSGRRGWNCSCF